MLDSMHKNYLLGSIPARPYPKEEAIQNDIEDLTLTRGHLRLDATARPASSRLGQGHAG